MSIIPFIEKTIWNLFDIRSDPDYEPDSDPYFRKQIRIHIKMKRIRNTDFDYIYYIEPPVYAGVYIKLKA